MSKLIKLTRGQHAIVDDEDFEKLNSFSWHTTSNGYAARRITRAGYSTIITMHEAILDVVTYRGGQMIDHVNRNKLDNRRENLRVVTNQQNQMNRAKKAKGVSFDSTHGKYKAYFDIITIGEPKRRVNIGTFLSEQDALLAVANYKESIK